MESSTSFTLTKAKTRSCRTSCTSSRRRDISRIVAIWIEWKMVVRFHGMLSLSPRCPKPPGKREISNMNEDLVNHSKDQLYCLAHWLEISQNSERNEARIHQFERNYYDDFWLCFINGLNLRRRHSDHWYWKIEKKRIDEARNKCIKKYISEDWMRKKSW